METAQFRGVEDGTLLRLDYLITGITGGTPDEITYSAQEVSTGNKLRIHEYFPSGLAERDTDEADTVVPKPEFIAEYIHRMYGFIRSYPEPGHERIIDVFFENQTVYVAEKFHV